jgi:hypothetical protein
LDTARDNKLVVAHTALLLNQAPNEPGEPLVSLIGDLGVERVVRLPYSAALRSVYEEGRGIPSLPEDDPLLAAICGEMLAMLDEFTGVGAKVGAI